MLEIDVLTLLAPAESVPAAVAEALERQGHVRLRRHLVVGRPNPGEQRVRTIARARNEARRCGSQPYVLFLDRDVVLPDRALEKLALGLAFHPGFAALGVNYQAPAPPPAVHVTMGATLFHRSVLERITFRTEPGLCECMCCCRDLRALGYRIDYLPGLTAAHWKPPAPA